MLNWIILIKDFILNSIILWLFSIKRIIYSISSGLEVFIELFRVAFLMFIDLETWKEIKSSKFLTQALGTGIIISLVIFWYSLLNGFSLFSLIFLSLQFLRFLSFLGLYQNQPIIQQEEESTVTNGAVRRIKSADQYIEELHSYEDF